ncbi:MAG: hypothetical protein JOY96_01745 [Verrucomicrobia bacterium]|nr:hypothetical protein [Verrucomicrobiota bacterium]
MHTGGGSNAEKQPTEDAALTEFRDQRWLFQDLGNRKVEVDFGGGYLSSTVVG